MKLKAEIRADRPDKKGRAPIRFVLSGQGQRRYIPTDLKLNKEYWDSETGLPVYKAPRDVKATVPAEQQLMNSEIIELIGQVTSLQNSIEETIQRLQRENPAISIEKIIEGIEAEIKPGKRKGEPEKYIFDYIDNYIDDREGITQQGSMTVYKALRRHLLEFQGVGPKTNRATFQNVDNKFLLAFQRYLSTLTKEVAGEVKPLMNNITIAKQISCLKTFLNYARKDGHPVNPKFKDFTVKKESLEVIALTNDEFEHLFAFEFSSSRLNQVRDIFCFSCVTGFRYSDLQQLRWEHIKADTIRLTMVKTVQVVEVPLNPYSLKILEKYKGRARPLPMISNAKANKYIKEACKIVGITAAVEKVRYYGNQRQAQVREKWEYISMHSGRKTFATLSLKRGISAEVVMAMGGWQDYKSFKRYVGIDDEMIMQASVKAWGAPTLEPRLRAV